MGIATEQLEFNFSCNGSDENPFSSFGIKKNHTYQQNVQSLVQRLVPPDFLTFSPQILSFQQARFADLLPIVRSSELVSSSSTFSILLLCKHRPNVSQFFYDFVSQWLIPPQKVNIELFFSSETRLPKLSEELLSVAEIVISLTHSQDVEEIRQNLSTLETEIKLGAISDYQARRILECKGLSSERKTSLIQEKIGSLIQKHSKDFDPKIFLQMQQFLIHCPEEFKNIRDYHHISRIISNLHSARKVLKKQVEALPRQRHIALKFLKTRLSYEKGKSKPVLGVLASLNFLQEHEVFEKDHLMAAIQKQIPFVQLVEGSFFVDPTRETSLQILYLEIEKKDGSDFSFEEIQRLRTVLPSPMEGYIEQLTHPIFMPRNEEEVLRNILALSRQLRLVHDTPQAILSFDETKGSDLWFTVIVVRFHLANTPSLETLIHSRTSLTYFPDRVRSLGASRRKYVKEATVFRTSLDGHLFLRSDRSIDLYKARGHILEELVKALGQVRDYNGGMILKQHEHLANLKQALGKIGQLHPILLEKFFHSISPMEMRTSTDIDSLKALFLLFIAAINSGSRSSFHENDFLFKQAEHRLVAILPKVTGTQKQKILSAIEALSIPSHQYAKVSLECQNIPYTGFLLLQAPKELQEKFLHALALRENN